MTGKLPDMNSYPRAEHFRYFRTLPYPYAGVTVEAAVDPVLRFSRENRQSFFLPFLHAVALAADSVPQLRQRIRGNGIIEYAACPASHTGAKADGTYCYLHPPASYGPFRLLPSGKSGQGRLPGIGVRRGCRCRKRIFYHFPGFITRPSFSPSYARMNQIPESAGENTKGGDGKQLKMPVSILAHHALVDGIHLARFYQSLEAGIQKFAGL